MNKIPIEQRLQQIRSQTQQAPQSGVRVPIEERLAQLRSQPKKEPTIEQQKQVIQTQGQPVSVRKDRTQPTLVGGIIRDIVKQPIKAALTIARPFVDPIGKKSGLSVNTKYLGNVGDYGTEIEKSTNNLANKYKAGEISLGRAALGGAGAGALQAMDFAAVAPVGKVASQAIRGTVKQSLVPTLKAAAKESLIRGGAVGAGYDVSSQLASGEKYNPLQTVAAGTIGTVADFGLSYGLPKTVAGTKSFAKNNLTKTGRDAKLTRKVEEELRNVENNYAKLRKNQKFSKDANTETRKRIIASGVLDDATDTTGTINTDNAIKKYRDASGLTGNEGVVRENLERLGEKVNLKSVEKELTDSIYASGLEGAELRTALNNVKKEISGYRLRADANGDVPLTFIHDTKIGTTSGINFMTPPEVKAYKKALASGLRSTVENNSQFNVKEVNQELSPLFKDIEYLESLNGRKVKGGKLGKYASQITGNIVGGAVGGAIGGFPGSAIGTVVGGEAGSSLMGSSLSKVLRGPGAKELPVSKVLQKAAATAKSPRLGLPEPKAGLPKSQNFVPIELPGVKEPVYRSPRIAGNTTQYTNIPNTKPKNIDIPTQLPKSKVKSSDLSTGGNKVAYHGTQAKQIVGTPNATDGSMGKAFYVTDNKGKAEVFGKEKNVLNQVITNNKGKKVKQYARESGYYKTSNVFDINLDGLNIKEFKDSNEFFKYISNSSKKDIPDWFKLSGYDGAYIKDSGTYAIYSPEKIKMPKGNQGVSLPKNTTEDLIQQAKKYKSAEELIDTKYTDDIEFYNSVINDVVNQENIDISRENAISKIDEIIRTTGKEGDEMFKMIIDRFGKTDAYKIFRSGFAGDTMRSSDFKKVFDKKIEQISKDAIDNVSENVSDTVAKQSDNLDNSFKSATVPETVDNELIQEAKKYKSAEEFVNDNAKYYKGFGEKPNGPINKTIDKKADWGEGIYITESMPIAEDYAQAFAKSGAGHVENISIAKNAKIADLTSNKELVLNYDDFLKLKNKYKNELEKNSAAKYILDTNLTNENIIYKRFDWEGNKNMSMYSAMQDVLQRAGVKDTKTYINNLIESKGYDGIEVLQSYTADLPLGKEDAVNFILFNPDVLKTKSQLTDIWNKANKK